jgi:hypothetical protein
MSAVRSNFLKLAFSAFQARTNLRDGFLAGSHLLCCFQEVNIRKNWARKMRWCFWSFSSQNLPHTANLLYAQSDFRQEIRRGIEGLG